MGPRHCCRGIGARLRTPECGLDRLQWGRGIAAAESRFGMQYEKGEQQASMGPRHCCRGILDGRGVPRSAGRCFNGAAALLPRNPRPHSGSLRRVRSFNGAAALLPRNPQAFRVVHPRLYTLQWGRGIAAAESLAGPPSVAARIWLQWGRGIAAAESWEHITQHSDQITASMGPRHCCRGIDSVLHSRLRHPALLQWGRGIAAAESITAALPFRHIQLASMGPRHCCRGILRRPRGRNDGLLASMGPRHCCRGISPPSDAQDTIDRSFNGAAALLPRNQPARRAGRPG